MQRLHQAQCRAVDNRPCSAVSGVVYRPPTPLPAAGGQLEGQEGLVAEDQRHLAGRVLSRAEVDATINSTELVAIAVDEAGIRLAAQNRVTLSQKGDVDRQRARDG